MDLSTLPTLLFLPLGPIARILALVSNMLRPRLDSLHRSLHRNAPLNDQVGQKQPVDGSGLGNKENRINKGISVINDVNLPGIGCGPGDSASITSKLGLSPVLTIIWEI